jgi:orotidine-5'-phosphate decarboxylase
LVPGIGAQGGSLEDVLKFGSNADKGLIINSSRGIIYADSSESFADSARKEATEVQIQMSKFF